MKGKLFGNSFENLGGSNHPVNFPIGRCKKLEFRVVEAGGVGRMVTAQSRSQDVKDVRAISSRSKGHRGPNKTGDAGR
jgi:hypothetical protein